MIKIEIRKKNNKIDYFKISGHANFKEYGQDIVCSAVSSISQMVLNGLIEVIKIDNIKYEIREGLLVCDLTNINFSEENRIKIDILLISMEKYFEEIAKEYKKYVKLNIKEV